MIEAVKCLPDVFSRCFCYRWSMPCVKMGVFSDFLARSYVYPSPNSSSYNVKTKPQFVTRFSEPVLTIRHAYVTGIGTLTRSIRCLTIRDSPRYDQAAIESTQENT